MIDPRFFLAKIASALTHKHEIMVNYYRRSGIKIGKNCLICSNISGGDGPLLEIGDRTVVSTNVEFVLHDFSISRVVKGKSNLFGRIVIGNNCFIGDRSVIMYGVTLADNIIVAAGSVVTKSFTENNIIIGGNPAKKIGDWASFRSKYEDKPRL